jgi:hypothetical protein
MGAFFWLLAAAFVGLGFTADRANAFVVSQDGPVITAKCSDGKATVGCSWCTKTGCFVVTKCSDGKCTVVKTDPYKGKGRGTIAAPIKTTNTGDKAPVTNSTPDRQVPVSIDRTGGSSKKH